MLTIDYTRPFLYPYQKQIVDSTERFTVTQAATKVGKSSSHLIWLFEQPLAMNLKVGQAVWWVAPIYAQAEIMFNRLRNQVSVRDFLKFNETKLTATYPTGAVMFFKSAEKPDSLYSDDVYAAVFDEFTRAREESWFALRTTLTSTGGKCKFIGNVRGKGNWGYKMAMKAKQGDDPNYAYFKITAYDAAAAGMLTKDGKPFIEEIEQAQRDLPDHVFKELYLAEASEDGSNPFGDKFIELCSIGMSTRPPVCFGIDLAKSTDWTVIIGLDQFGQVCHFERFQKDWMMTVQHIRALPDIPTEIDSTGVGDPILEQAQQGKGNVIGKKFTQISKQQLMEGLAAGIHQRKVLIPKSTGIKLLTDDPGHIKNELESFEFEVTRTGTYYSAPSGFHDDCVSALALVYDIYPTASAFGQYSWS